MWCQHACCCTKHVHTWRMSLATFSLSSGQRSFKVQAASVASQHSQWLCCVLTRQTCCFEVAEKVSWTSTWRWSKFHNRLGSASLHVKNAGRSSCLVAVTERMSFQLQQVFLYSIFAEVLLTCCCDKHKGCGLHGSISKFFCLLLVLDLLSHSDSRATIPEVRLG